MYLFDVSVTLIAFHTVAIKLLVLTAIYLGSLLEISVITTLFRRFRSRRKAAIS
jgi:hypothetical protein